MKSWLRRCTRSGSRGSKGRKRETSSSTLELDHPAEGSDVAICDIEKDIYGRVGDGLCCLLSQPSPAHHLAQPDRRGTHGATLDGLWTSLFTIYLTSWSRFIANILHRPLSPVARLFCFQDRHPGPRMVQFAAASTRTPVLHCSSEWVARGPTQIVA